jgi:hypothetical protein
MLIIQHGPAHLNASNGRAKVKNRPGRIKLPPPQKNKWRNLQKDVGAHGEKESLASV